MPRSIQLALLVIGLGVAAVILLWSGDAFAGTPDVAHDLSVWDAFFLVAGKLLAGAIVTLCVLLMLVRLSAMMPRTATDFDEEDTREFKRPGAIAVVQANPFTVDNNPHTKLARAREVVS